MFTHRKRKADHSDENPKSPKKKKEILLCGHASWVDTDGYTTVPDGTFLYLYAPLGAALSQTIPRAIVAGEVIKKGALTIQRISPITLFNLGYEDRGEMKGDFRARDKEVLEYPIRLGPGDRVPNYTMVSPGKDSLEASERANVVVNNIKEKDMLDNILKNNVGNTCHFGGCSWIRQENDKRDLVTFKDNTLEDKYTVKLSHEEKKQ